MAWHTDSLCGRLGFDQTQTPSSTLSCLNASSVLCPNPPHGTPSSLLAAAQTLYAGLSGPPPPTPGLPAMQLPNVPRTIQLIRPRPLPSTVRHAICFDFKTLGTCFSLPHHRSIQCCRSAGCSASAALLQGTILVCGPIFSHLCDVRIDCCDTVLHQAGSGLGFGQGGLWTWHQVQRTSAPDSAEQHLQRCLCLWSCPASDPCFTAQTLGTASYPADLLAVAACSRHPGCGARESPSTAACRDCASSSQAGRSTHCNRGVQGHRLCDAHL